jgi:SAM-dependent methyltransferase
MTVQARRSLPERYYTPWRPLLLDASKDVLVPGAAILDIGSGRTPAIPVDLRPQNCHYVGLDISLEELTKAPAGAYSQAVVGDATCLESTLVGRFDLVVTWQVLEHVESTQKALDCMHAYLKPGGRMVSMLSGKNTLFAIPNRIVPHRVAVFAMEQLLNRPPKSVFPAHYNLCSYDELGKALETWSERDIRCIWRGAGYLGFNRPLQQLYLAFEDRAGAANLRNLATHYLIVANR